MSQQAKPLGEVSWVQPATKGDKPTPRSGHTITVTGDKAVIFGGCGITKDNEPIVSNQTYYLNMSSDPMKWEEVRTPTPPHGTPLPRPVRLARRAEPLPTRTAATMPPCSPSVATKVDTLIHLTTAPLRPRRPT